MCVGDGGSGLRIDHVPSMCEALGSIFDAVPLKEKIQVDILRS